MPTLLLSERLYGRYAENGLNALDALLRGLLGGLEVYYEIRVEDGGWVDVEVEGADSSVASSLISKEIGLRPSSVEEALNLGFWRGRISAVTQDGLLVDLGCIEAVIPLRELALQLEVEDERGLEVYGLYQRIPVEVRVYELLGGRRVRAGFSDRFISRLHGWGLDGLRRIVVVGATLSLTRRLLRRVRLERCVAYYERLGVLEHHVACKIGVDYRMIARCIAENLSGVEVYLIRPKPIGYLTPFHHL